jgi:hypothetical protein
MRWMQKTNLFWMHYFVAEKLFEAFAFWCTFFSATQLPFLST